MRESKTFNSRGLSWKFSNETEKRNHLEQTSFQAKLYAFNNKFAPWQNYYNTARIIRSRIIFESRTFFPSFRVYACRQANICVVRVYD